MSLIPGKKQLHLECKPPLFFRGRMTKRGTPLKTLTKRGALLFVDREVFNVHVVVAINSTAQQDVCASTVHFYSSY